MNRRELPIFELENELVAALRRTPRVVLEAPTGSGKSTQVPQMLLDHGLLGNGEIVVLQPRRLPARMLANRVASERGGRTGDEVGYQIRLDRVCSAATRIRYVTEGILLRQMLADPNLRGVAAICFDEFHERHLYSDITLARALEIQETTRPDLLLTVMSATLETAALRDYLAPCEFLVARGRTYPVDISYLQRSPGEKPLWEIVTDEFERLAAQTEGDVLVFLPGSYEIHRTIEALRNSRAGRECVILPLHGDLPPAEQDAAMARQARRKIVVSTNVAETSLTIDGVRVVIDGGLAKIARFDPYRGINTLLTSRISRASADQRAGRAGRTAPGLCLRLWTERDHGERPAQELPEVKRMDLAEVVLTLKAAGVLDVDAFRWLEKPEPRALERALVLLQDLGALESTGAISPLGRRMLAFPVHPRYARMLLAADEYGCVPEAAAVAALTQGRPLLRRGSGSQLEKESGELSEEETGSDFFLLLKALRFAERAQFDVRRCEAAGIHAGAAREAAALVKQFLQIATAENLYTSHSNPDPEAVRRCVLAGFPDQVAIRMDAGTLRCALVHGRRGVLARESVVQNAPLLVACEVREVEARGAERQVLLTLATAVREEWLRELFPSGFEERTDVSFDTTQRRVVAKQIVRFRDVLLRSKDTDRVPLDAAAGLLASEVEAGRCPLKNWDDAVDQWIARANLVAHWFPEQALPSITAADRRMLVEQICHGAISYKDIKERPVWPIVKSWLSDAQAAFVERLAPERVEMPNGKKFKVVYAAKASPTIAVRIQDLYGVEGELRVGGGRVALVIEVLAPNQRPIQVTQNLSNFWKESYPKIKQELQRKYPRHEWR
ncbi:MAG: ATP-dependent helicase HrpB [Verrucomicrobia bacterium]|nr:MAG: ATP-dependent helicase HrpB [Verrucomicrobiota bacterium]